MLEILQNASLPEVLTANRNGNGTDSGGARRKRQNACPGTQSGMGRLAPILEFKTRAGFF